MSKKTKLWIGCGIFSVLFLLASSWYAVTFNDSRLVAPMQGHYAFQLKDLPMILSVSLICVYVIALFITLMLHAGKMRRQQEKSYSQTQSKTWPFRAFGVPGLWRFLDILGKRNCFPLPLFRLFWLLWILL